MAHNNWSLKVKSAFWAVFESFIDHSIFWFQVHMLRSRKLTFTATKTTIGKPEMV